MGNCCDKTQDWCRDVCGCCPCSCCKTKEVKAVVQQEIVHKIEKRETPFGYVVIHPGISTGGETYTSPVAEVHTWRKSSEQSALNEGSATQRVALGGRQTQRDNADRHVGPVSGIERRGIEVNEEVICIPIESILSIQSTNEVKKNEVERRTERPRTPVIAAALSCCEQCSRWCCRAFCCKEEPRVVVTNEPRPIDTSIDNQKAERRILITIEYVSYSNIDTPSHVQVLDNQDKAAFYKENLAKKTVEFFLLCNSTFDDPDFAVKREQAASLCRLVTQLKMMSGKYPSGRELEQLVSRESRLTMGNPANETISALAGAATTRTSLAITAPPPTTQHQ